jgi:predicted Rdx family selenoprotein
MPHWFQYFDTIDDSTSSYDATLTEICSKFYSSISIRWLVRANFMAYRSAVLTLNSKGIKNVTVFPTCGGFTQTIKFINSKYPETTTWDQSELVSIHPSETESQNHIPLESAQKLAQQFSFE